VESWTLLGLLAHPVVDLACQESVVASRCLVQELDLHD